MKKIILIFIVASMFLQLAKGQEYIPLLGENKQWNVNNVMGGHGPFSITRIFRTTNKDTIMDNKKYQIIELFDSISNSISNLFVREDSTKFFIRVDDPWSIEEYLLYDFSLGLGDTITMYNKYKYIIDSIDSIVLCNYEKRKVWNLYYVDDPPYSFTYCSTSYYPYETYDDKWIEGIGSIKGLLSPGCNHGNSYDLSVEYATLLCFYENNILTYDNPYADSCFYHTNVSLPNEELYSISYFPNPTTDYIYIENISNIQITKVTLFNMLQNNTYDIEIKTNSIDVSSYPSGMYFLIIYFTNNRSQIFKIIKL